MQGMTKKSPGPLAPPALSLPSLKMTALSYSCTTLTQLTVRLEVIQEMSLPLTFTHMQRERGSVARNRRNEAAVRKREQIPGPSGSATNEVL